MKEKVSTHLPRQWNEARHRAEIYLHALRSQFGLVERKLVARALIAAREQHRRNGAAHPVTLTMESLFEILWPEKSVSELAMAPPMQRATMLPEPTEFPLHDWLRRLFRRRMISFAGAR